MRIMFLSGSYRPAQDGVAHVTEYLAEGLAKKHEVLMLAPFGKTDVQKEIYQGVVIERHRIDRKLSTYMVGEKREVLQRIYEYNPEVLIVVGIQNWGFDWTKKILNQLPGKKILMTHGSSCLGEYKVWDQIKKIRPHRQIVADFLNVYITWYWKRYQKSFPKYVKQFDKVTYLFDKEPLHLFMLEQGAENDVVLENATEDFFFTRKAFEVDSNKPVLFINVSNYSDLKNQKMLLQAYYEVNIPNAEFVLIGSRRNQYYDELVKLNDEMAKKPHQCKKAEIYVNIPREEVLTLYQKADVYLAASKQEVMSISICEAAAAGLTILSTPVGHAPELPFVCIFDTYPKLLEQMREICENPLLREERGRAGFEYAMKKYKISSKVDALEEIVLSL